MVGYFFLSGFLIGDAPGWRWLTSAGTSARLHCMSDADDRYANNLFDRLTDISEWSTKIRLARLNAI